MQEAPVSESGARPVPRPPATREEPLDPAPPVRRLLRVHHLGLGERLVDRTEFGWLERHQRAAGRPAQPLDAPHERSGVGDRGGDVVRRAIEVLGEQSVTEADDGPGEPVRTRPPLDHLDRQVALGVQAHRAVVHVAGTEAQKAVVDDGQLGVHIDVLALLRNRRVEPEPVVHVGPADDLQHPGARGAHRLFREPALGGPRVEHDDIGAVGLAQPLGDRLGDPAAGEVLALHVDRAAGRGDRRQPQQLDLVHQVLAVVLGAGAGDRDVDVGEQGLDLLGPALPLLGDLLEPLPGAALPPLASEFGDRMSGGPGHHAGRVVPRPGRPALGASGCRTTSVRVAVGVVGGVPAVRGDVDAADEGQAVVDDHDLLVMRSADRVVGVDGEGEPVGTAPVEQHDRLQTPAERAQHAEVPLEDADLQPRVLLHRLFEHGAEPVVLRPAAAERVEPDPRVEIPADEQHSPLGMQHGTLQGGEVAGRVDEDREAGGPLDPPAGLAGDQQRRALLRPALVVASGSAGSATPRSVSGSVVASPPSITSAVCPSSRTEPTPDPLRDLVVDPEVAVDERAAGGCGLGPGRVGLDAMRGRRRT